MAKNVLMVRPSFFRVDYKINPWMKIGKVNLKRANQQWENLVKAYQKSGIKVEIIEQVKELPDMVFTADQGLPFKKNCVILSNFRCKERQGESLVYKEWFLKNKYRVLELPPLAHFEGTGNCLFYKKHYLIGNGFRSFRQIREMIKKTGNQPVFLDLVDPRFYHLDLALFVLNQQTAFYYPPALSKKSQAIIKSLFPCVFEFKKQEALNFAANSVIHKNIVFVQKNNPIFCYYLKKMGYKPTELDMSEFMKAGGGIHCLTLILSTYPL